MDVEAAREMATRLMEQHGLGDWRLVFDRARTRAGVCRPARREIGLSRTLTQLHSETEMTDTVLHEIAHALVGAEHGHDEVWRARALAIGCSAARCMPRTAARPPAPWVGTCPAGHTTGRHRRPSRPASCSTCSRRFDPSALLEWRLHGRKVPMSAGYLAELATVRGVDHAQVGVPSRPGGAARPESAADAGTGRGARGVRVPARQRPVPLPEGTPVVLGGRGRWAGVAGRIEKRGRSRYQVRTAAGLVSAPFELVQRA